MARTISGRADFAGSADTSPNYPTPAEPTVVITVTKRGPGSPVVNWYPSQLTGSLADTLASWPREVQSGTAPAVTTVIGSAKACGLRPTRRHPNPGDAPCLYRVVQFRWLTFKLGRPGYGCRRCFIHSGPGLVVKMQ